MSRPISLLILAGLIVLGAPLAPTHRPASADAAGNTPGLFVAVDGADGLGSAAADAAVVRSRPVRIDLEQLGQIGPSLATSTFRDRVGLNFFDDTVLTALLNRVEPNATGGGYAWIGTVEGRPYSLALLVIKDGRLLGTVYTLGATYEVQPAEGGLHIIREIHPSALPRREGDDALRPPEDAAPPAAGQAYPTGAGVLGDDGSTIDVMIAYTPALRSAVGGREQVLLRIDAAIAFTNAAYANSGIAPRLRLVQAVEVAYTESGSGSTDLNRITGKKDGYMDEIHALRDAVFADLVALWGASSSQYSASGVAWILPALDPYFESYGFSVTLGRAPSLIQSVFAHELGHNMGAHHDWYVTNERGLYTYSHGLVHLPGRWRTIMAYGDACWDSGFYCSEIPYFSNPDISYEGSSTGVPPGTNVSCSVGNLDNPGCDAANARTLNNSALLVANFRAPISLPALTAGLSHTPYLVRSTTQTIHYGITVRNIGDAAATGVQVTDTIPGGTEYVTGSASSGGQFSGGQITWAGLTIEPQGSLSLSFDLDAAAPFYAGQVLVNTVQVSSTEGVGLGPAEFITIVDPNLVFLPAVAQQASAH